ncbi:MAG: polyhydroxyalkanoate depolymerase [Marivibrio sp.]|uniref:polyhydroxyalkanoate depolymerase n=1 Tax=Marivibrio sp. TaxID=2039719 RepID=UPI0032F08097
MLYNMHDARTQALVPMRLMAEATRLAFLNPFQPLSYTPFGRMMASASTVMEGLLTEREKPEWGLARTHIDGEAVPIAIETAVETPFCNLLHFKRLGAAMKRRTDPAILLVAPMSGHHATLLRGTVEALLPDHEVYVTDWIDARLVPKAEGRFGVARYIDTVIDFMRFMADRDGGAGETPYHAMAVCQPAPLVMAAAAILAEQDAPHAPNGMILMGGPIDPAANPTIVTQAAENRSIDWFEHHGIHRVPARYPGANRRVYPGFLQLRAFMAMNPGRHTDAHWRMFRHLVRGDGESADKTATFYDEYMAVMDTAADFYLETVDQIFKRRLLPKGEFLHHGRRVNPAAIVKTALMTIEGELDDISAPGQTEAAHRLCASIPKERRRHLVQPGVGHYGIFNGRKWREEIKPQIAEFVRETLAQ